MKKSMGTIIERVIRTHGLTESAEVIDYIKALGLSLIHIFTRLYNKCSRKL